MQWIVLTVLLSGCWVCSCAENSTFWSHVFLKSDSWACSDDRIFFYSIFFPQAWGYSTVTECLHIAHQSIPNTRKGKKRLSSLVAGFLYLFNTSLLRYTVALTLPAVKQSCLQFHCTQYWHLDLWSSYPAVGILFQIRTSPSRGDFYFTFKQNWNCPWIQCCFRSYLKISFFVQVLRHTQNKSDCISFSEP